MGISQNTIIVVPCFNEAARLNVTAFEDALQQDPALRFIFVDDGSTDDTQAVLARMSERNGRAHYRILPRNAGKAEAVRHGILEALALEPELVGYWDADLATPLRDISAFASVFDDPNIILVLGSRVRLLGRHIDRTPLRHYLGRIFASAASNVLGLPIYDTQCGAKLFRNVPWLRSIFERPFELNWCFDVELIARLRGLEAKGLCSLRDQCVEYALESWTDAPGSKLNLRQVPRVLGEIARLGLIVRAERLRARTGS